MKRVALALSLLLVAACDLNVSTSALNFDAGLALPDGGSIECGQNPCSNDGECMLTSDGFKCTCQPGYEGDLCDIDVNDCNPNPCLNDGVCTDGVASYTCACAPGFEGVDCSTNIDECADAPCLNDGTCTDMVNGYQCDCAAGYAGTQCEVDVDDCASSPCENDGACVDAVNGFTCLCTEGHSGVTCSDSIESCKEDTCQNGGTCADSADGYTCTCLAGYNGANCETDVDDCATVPCENGATCTDKVNGYSCECPEGTTGVNCENPVNPCEPNPCLNGSECGSAGSDSFVCSCAPGYKGASCEINIDDCASNPCSNGGTCTDAVNDFSCECPNGYEGRTCNSDPPGCPEENPCLHGTCVDGLDGYKCECDAGYSGLTCEVNVDDCEPNPCAHGECSDGANSFTCACEAGYDGAACDHDIVDCKSDSCKNGGTCVEQVDGYSCTCAAGYGGDDCSANINDCTPSSCQHGGTCRDGLNAYTCECPRFFTGDHCEVAECALVGVCSGHGMCNSQSSSCSCDTGWNGDDCELNINECTTADPCLHGGGCTDNLGSYTCACATGYRGLTCDACDTGYQDDDDDDVCCRTGYKGSACDVCEAGYEKLNGVCQKTCASTGLQCGAHGTCSDNSGNPICNCQALFFGPVCDSFQGTCSASTCGANGECVSTSDNTYKCTCEAAYVGRSCETRDECMVAVNMGMTPCSNHGQCVDGNNMYSCTCQAGWLGAECNNSDECYAASQNGQDACNNHGSCSDGNMTYTCSCTTGWLGAHCDNADNCIGSTCMHSGVCLDGNNTYTCDCSATDYQGDHCETKIDRCLNVTACKHGGTCVDTGPTYTCDCAKTGYGGATCEADANECLAAPNVCNTGVCTNAAAAGGGYTCQCPDGTLDVEGDGTSCASIISLAAGALDTCAITTAGSLHCWGDNGYGQLAAGNITNPTARLPKRIGPASGWQTVSVGQGHICGIRAGHLYCWGRNDFTQVAPTSNSNETSLVEIRSDLTWSDVSAGDTHTCALAAGSLYCWGNTASGQAGTAVNGTRIDAPKQIAGTYLAVSAGANHTCSITTGNQLKCIGRNVEGQLGGATQPIPTPPSGIWTAVKAGPTHTCAIAGGDTYCWGSGTQGALGNGTTSDSTTPVAVTPVAGLGSLGTGQDFSCAMAHDSDGSTTFQLYCWGTNANGLLLTNDSLADEPQIVSRGSSKWSAYALGKTHLCAVDDGLLYCWGSNATGALGTGSTDGMATHTPAAMKTAVVAHDATNNCSPNPCQNGGVCTDAANGFTCNCTGTGYGGTTCTSETDECTNTPGICAEGICADLLGNQGYTCRCPDGQVDVDGRGVSCAKVQTVAAGNNHTCVLTEEKTLHCWGSNRYGQLGLGEIGTTLYYTDETTQTIRTPLRLSDITGITGAVAGWTKLAVGEKHTCGTLPSGSNTDALYCWGDNTNGQVGAANTDGKTYVAKPLLLDNTQAWTTLAAGYSHTCGIVASGAMYCWGFSKNAQVGNGASTNTPQVFSLMRPVALPPGETAWVSVAGGASHTCATTNTQTTYCWGRNVYPLAPYSGLTGQIGIGAVTTDTLNPTKVMLSDPQGFTNVTGDFAHTCGLTSTSTYCWGFNGSGGVGNGTFTSPQTTPVLVTGAPAFTSLASGSDFSCGLLPVNGTTPQAYTAYCWGSNSKGVLLTGGGNVNLPTQVTTRTWDQFSAGTGHICAIDHADGLLYCWGDNGSEGTPAAGIGKLGYIPEGTLGVFGIGSVKAAAVTHPAAN